MALTPIGALGTKTLCHTRSSGTLYARHTTGSTRRTNLIADSIVPYALFTSKHGQHLRRDSRSFFAKERLVNTGSGPVGV